MNTEKTEAIDRLEEIQSDIGEMIREALELVRLHGTSTDEARFKGYPYAHIVGALSNDHEFLGGSMTTMEDCIESMRGEAPDGE